MPAKKAKEKIVITAPNMVTMMIPIRGLAPYVQCKFSKKAREEMLQTQMQGSRSKTRKSREPRNIEVDYQEAMHISDEGKHGIPAAAFRAAMISACRLVNFTMTAAKIAIFVEADALDADEGTGLVHIKGEPQLHQGHVRLASGVASIAIRPMWRKWSANVRVRFDADQFSASDVVNLMARAGAQVGVGEGRPDSKKSNGMGWGIFEVLEQQA